MKTILIMNKFNELVKTEIVKTNVIKIGVCRSSKFTLLLKMGSVIALGEKIGGRCANGFYTVAVERSFVVSRA